MKKRKVCHTQLQFIFNANHKQILQQTEKKDEKYYRTPQRLQTMILRYHLRNFDTYNKKEKEFIYKHVKDNYYPPSSHPKPV